MKIQFAGCQKRACYRLHWQGCVNSVVNERWWHKEVQTMTSEWIDTHTRTPKPCRRFVSPSFGWMLGESFQENEMFLWLNYIDTFFYLFAIWCLFVSLPTAFLVSATCNDELFAISRFTPDWLLLPSRTKKNSIHHECVDNRSISAIKRNTIHHSKSITKLEVKTKHECRALQRFSNKKLSRLSKRCVSNWLRFVR